MGLGAHMVQKLLQGLDTAAGAEMLLHTHSELSQIIPQPLRSARSRPMPCEVMFK